MIGSFSVAAATAVLKYDLASGETWRQSSRPRRIVAMGLAGSAAALDTEVEVFVGEQRVGEMYNAATGAVTRDHMFRISAYVPGGEEVHVYVVDAPVTNAINGAIDFEDM